MLDQQIAELMKDEGLRLLVYDDGTGLPIKPGTVVKGHATIGFGRALDVHGISQDEAGALLANDLLVVEKALTQWPWYTMLDPVRRGVMINLAYNLGVHGLLGFARMIGALQRLDFEGAAHELASSRWVHQVQPSRSSRLIAQLRTGVLAASESQLHIVAPSPVIPPAAVPAPPAADTVDEDNVADALNQAELDRIRGTGQ